MASCGFTTFAVYRVSRTSTPPTSAFEFPALPTKAGDDRGRRTPKGDGGGDRVRRPSVGKSGNLCLRIWRRRPFLEPVRVFICARVGSWAQTGHVHSGEQGKCATRAARPGAPS